MNKVKFILASASPRRRELLDNIGLEFEIEKSDFDESTLQYDGKNPSLYVQEMALLKANDAAKKLDKKENTIIISADTMVCMGNKILGKPSDEKDAENMLKMLSGREHQVYTGVCVYRLPDGTSTTKAEVTNVKFKNLTEGKIKAYVATKEPMDKAGAYGIQGIGSMLVEKIDGDYFNVVGLPVSMLADILEEEYNISLF